MKLTVGLLLTFLTLAQGERDWSKVFPNRLPDPPAFRMSHGIPDPKITGGEEATPNSIPYQAAVFSPMSAGTGFCGGSLVSRHTVLTAAHCVDSVIAPVEVVLGAHRIREDEPTQVRRRSERIIIHPNWSASTLRNDLALIILEAPVELTPQIQIIELAIDSSNTFEGHEATVSGWGLDSDSSTTISNVLRKVTVPVISNTICRIAFLGVVQDSHICTSGLGGRSTCNGDSGGPLTVGGVQIGIVSFGIALGCEVGYPAAYTRTTYFSSWVRDNLV